MKKVILGLFLISLISCNSDDNDDGNPETFLALNKGTTWKYTEDEDNNGEVDINSYVKFKEDLDLPFESWYANNMDLGDDDWCFSYEDYRDVQFIEVLQNSSEKLSVRVTFSPTHYSTVQITKSGDRIKVVTQGNDGMDYGNTMYYDKTSDNLNNLKVCQ